MCNSDHKAKNLINEKMHEWNVKRMEMNSL